MELELHAYAKFNRYSGLEEADMEDDHLYAHMLVQVGASARVEHHFKIVLAGNTRLRAAFRADQFSQLASLKDYSFSLKMDPSELAFRQNGFTTKWEDLDVAVSSGRVRVSLPSKADAEAEFRSTWEAMKRAENPAAAAIRWGLKAHEAYGFSLVLQCLPGTARQLRKDGRLDADTARTIELAVWVAVSKMRYNDWFGPEPILFTKDAVATQENLQLHPERFLSGNIQVNLRKEHKLTLINGRYFNKRTGTKADFAPGKNPEMQKNSNKNAPPPKRGNFDPGREQKSSLHSEKKTSAYGAGNLTKKYFYSGFGTLTR